MINIDLLKSEVYKKEKRKLYLKSLLFNLIAAVVISLSLSSVASNQKEQELLKENYAYKYKADSLEQVLTVELLAMKERENKIIRSALSLSEDTAYVDFNPYSNNIVAMAENQSRSLDLMDDIIADRWDSINCVPVGMPVTIAELTRISDEYGWRKHPIHKKWIFHEGTDFAAPLGSNILSTSDGVIERVIKSKKGYGNRIIIDHGYGYKTVYAHLKSFNVEKGDVVKKGDVIGYVGSTGLSTGPHLHYEVLVNNRPLNPQQFFYYGDVLATK